MNNSVFFNNKECEFFPCHETDSPDRFNCMFCYCPLYMLADRCGGDYVYLKDGTKDCSGCLLPHREDFEDTVVRKWPEIRTRAEAPGQGRE